MCSSSHSEFAMAEGGRELYSVVEVDDISATESMMSGNVTRYMADALMALRRTPLRSDASTTVGLTTYYELADDVSSLRLPSCLSSCQDTIGYVPQASGTRYESLFPNTYAVSFSHDSTTL